MNCTQPIHNPTYDKENPHTLHIKTEQPSSDTCPFFPSKSINSDNHHFIKRHKPFLQSTKIQFNIRTNRDHSSTSTKSIHHDVLANKETNIDRLKR